MFEGVPIRLVEKMIHSSKLKINVQGQSMEPLYKEGDVINIVSAENAEEGDIVLVHDGTSCVIHRLIGTDEGLIYTKGDNNKYMDFPNPRTRILGKVAGEAPGKKSKENHAEIVFVFWRKSDYEACRELADKMGCSVVLADKLFKDGKNIAVLQTSLKNLDDYRGEFIKDITSEERIYIHLNVPISDYVQKGFVLDTEFDRVFRSGSLKMNHRLSVAEKFLTLLSEISLFADKL